MKRPSAAVPNSESPVSKEPTPKQRRKSDVDPLAAKRSSVAKALRGAKALPQDVRDMLVDVLGDILTGEVPAERHAFQEEVIGFVKEALDGVETGLTANVAECETTISTADEERTRRELVKEEAVKVASEKELAVNLAKEELGSILETLNAARGNLGDMAIKHQEAQTQAAKVKEDQQKLEQLASAVLGPLKDGTVEKGKVLKERVKELGVGFTELGGESSMKDAVVITLAKEPEARGTFDTLVVHQIDGWFATKKESLSAAVAEAQPGVDAAAAAVTAAEGVRDAEFAKRQEAEVKLSDAKAQLNTANSDVKSAAAAIAEHARIMAGASTALEKAKQQLVTFREGPLADFEELRAGPPPVVETTATEETAATEEAAQPDSLSPPVSAAPMEA